MIGTIINVHDKKTREPDPVPSENPSVIQLAIRLKGDTPAKEILSKAVGSTRRAVKQIGRVLLSGRPGEINGPGRKIEKECELFIVSWDESKARAVLELPPPQAQLSLFGDIGEDSLSCFLHGLEEIAQHGLDPTKLPLGFDQAVLQSCLHLSELLNKGISSIVYLSAAQKTTLDRACRDRLCQYLTKPPRLERWSLFGRLEALSGRGRLTGVVWDESGSRWICRFKSEHLPHLSAAWMRCVELAGKAILEPNRDRVLEVESIAVPGALTESGEGNVFAADSTPFDGGEPADLLNLLPPEDSPEEILKNILGD